MKVLVTGAEGFIGRNLQQHLHEREDVETVAFTRDHDADDLANRVRGVDWVFHLAGINRPTNVEEFTSGNVGLTSRLLEALEQETQNSGRSIPVVFSSSIQAQLDNPYGISKRQAEQQLADYASRTGSRVHLFRLPNVFGKWSRPNYNSAVATFCHNIARDLPIQIHDPDAPMTLVYIDDVVQALIKLIDGDEPQVDAQGFADVEPKYTTTVGEVADLIRSFRESRDTLITERVGTGLTRALHATYLSFLPPESFAYAVKQHGDARGVFVEMLKTPDCGQFSYFTAHPGITRGGHYHHSKTEKFLVLTGEARFKFRHVQTGETYEITTNGEKAEIVETVPGWTHDITNIGRELLVVMLWANEIFDADRPDTFADPL